MEIDKRLWIKVIELVPSEWASPVVSTHKKDIFLQFCVDYRKLNAFTVKGTYPAFHVNECTDSNGEVRIFLTSLVISSYWKLEIDERNSDKTTSTLHSGLYRFICMPYGIRNAPSTLQHAMNVMVLMVEWQVALAYFHDIVIFLRLFSDHLSHLCSVFG